MEYQKNPLSVAFQVDALVNISYYRLSRDYAFPGEVHDCWEFLYVDRGSLVVTAGTDTYYLKAGEMAFHCPNEFHAFQAVGEADILVVAFCCESPAMHRLEKRVVLLHQSEKKHLKLLVKEAGDVYQHFENAPPHINLGKKEDAPWGCDQMIKTYLEQFFIYVCRRDDNIRLSQRAVSTGHSRQTMVLAQQVQVYLEEHYTERISLDSLAAEFDVSVSQIKRVFREQVGKSMLQYLTDLRVGQAKRLIRQGNLSFTQVAELVGYESIYYFSALFKKHTGLTLTEYAQSVKD